MRDLKCDRWILKHEKIIKDIQQFEKDSIYEILLVSAYTNINLAVASESENVVCTVEIFYMPVVMTCMHLS